MTADQREPTRRQIFLSYAHEDASVAIQIADRLREVGFETWGDQWELASGDSIAERIEETMASADLLLVLLSQASINSRWVQAELSAESFASALRDRAVVVIPVLIENCQIPLALADRPYFDLRHDRAGAIQKLAAQLKAAPELDLSRLDPLTFERLVADLLTKIGFSIIENEGLGDQGFDFAATFQDRDPFGAARTTNWLVEVKLYKSNRISVSVLQQLFAQLSAQPVTTRGLLVTDSRLTSVAREFVEQTAKRTGREIRVVDGTELTSLLLSRPDVVWRHLPSAKQT